MLPDGDTIFVRAGVYVESVVVDKAITLKGEGADFTRLYGLSLQTTVIVQHNGVIITGFTIDGGPDLLPTTHNRGGLAGIHLLNVQNCTVYGNKVVDCKFGVWLYGSSGNNVYSNVLDNKENGVMIDHSSDNTVTGNVAMNGENGIKLSESWGNTLRDNNMANNTNGFIVFATDAPNYLNDVDASNLVDGKRIYYLVNRENLVITPSSYPEMGFLALVNCSGITVKNCSGTDEYCGILLVENSNTTLTQNTLAEDLFGIWIKFCSNCTVSANNIESSREFSSIGIQVETSDGINIFGNTLMEVGVSLLSSSYNLVAENTLTNCTNYYGIRLDSSSNNIICRNQLISNSLNIVLSSSSDNKIESNSITVGGDGIQIYNVNSDRNIIDGNTIANQSGSGIFFGQSYDNKVSSNNLTGNGVGIGMMSSFRNTFTGNNITESALTISLSASEDSTFYNNNFITDKTQVHDAAWDRPTASSAINHWDNGTIGNFRSNYTGTDANGDGIGDTPYVIDNRNKDRYPLISPFIAPILSPSPSPTETQSPSPSPTVPEFTPLAALIVAAATCLVAVTVRKTKLSKPAHV